MCDTPEAGSFTELAEDLVLEALGGREGVFGNYSRLLAERKPNPEHLTAPRPAQA